MEIERVEVMERQRELLTRNKGRSVFVIVISLPACYSI